MFYLIHWALFFLPPKSFNGESQFASQCKRTFRHFHKLEKFLYIIITFHSSCELILEKRLCYPSLYNDSKTIDSQNANIDTPRRRFLLGDDVDVCCKDVFLLVHVTITHQTFISKL